MNEFFEATRESLKKNGFPTEDAINKENCLNEFDSGGHYGVEISSMNNITVIKKAFQLAEAYDLKIDRLIECRGIVRLPDEEISEMVDFCHKEQVGLLMSVGPRAISDIGAFAGSPNGKRVGYRLRGMENMIHAIEDVKRGIRLGVRGFVIYDEGMLVALNAMRANNELPADTIFKYSVHAGCSNPLSAKLLEDNGCDTINVIPDLDVEMLSAFRPLVKGPIDVFSDTAKSAGGLLRTYDMAKVIKYASPVYLKCGPISQPEQNHLPTDNELSERIKQAKNVVEHVERYLPQARRVNPEEKTLAIPVPCMTLQAGGKQLLPA
jgi:hypothetical protein